MQMSLGDLADRLVINIRKNRISPGTVTFKEMEELQKSIYGILLNITPMGSLPKNQSRFLQLLCELADVNYGIWELESQLKTGREQELELGVIGSRAIRIRDLNYIRVQIKNEMNKLSGTGFQDIKINHGSSKVKQHEC